MELQEVYNGKTIEEVVGLLGKYNKDSKIIAGGTDIVIELKNEKISPKILIDISKIEELKRIEENEEYISIGAGVTFTEIVENPFFKDKLYGLYKACKMVGSPQIRNKGTIGGNIANGGAAADSVPPLIALGSIVTLESIEGIREIALEKYYDDPIRENELLTKIRFKKPNKNQTLSFSKLGLRKALAISRLTTSALIEFEEENIKTIRVASGALGITPLREYKIEEYLTGKKIEEETIIGAIDTLEKSMEERLKGRSTLPYKSKSINTILRETLEESINLKNEVKS